MKRQRLALIVVLVAVAVPLVGLLLVEAQLRERLSRRPEVGSIFPVLAASAEETDHDSSGRQRVVVFAKAGCGNCDRTISTLARLAVKEEFDLTAVVVGSAIAGTDDGAFQIAPDPDGVLAKRFGVIKVPLVFILDGESRVQATVIGERPESVWRSVLNGHENAI